MSKHFTSVMAALAAMAGPAAAMEGISPLAPGATTGNPAAVLPPSGLYLTVNTTLEHGYIKDGSGNRARTPDGQTIRALNASTVGSLLWVPGWEVFGASYGAMIAKPLKYQTTTFSEGTRDSTFGAVNTAISPAILSWNLGNGLFIGTGVAFILKDGTVDSEYDAEAGRYVNTTSNVGNNFWTIEPNIAISYMKDDWSFTLNNIFDFSTKNKKTDYQSGNVYYLDTTATKKIDNWTFGLIGNYTTQLTDDKIFGESIGNRIRHIKAGPMVAYDFEKYTVSARYLQAIDTRNDANVSFFHVGLSLKLF